MPGIAVPSRRSRSETEDDETSSVSSSSGGPRSTDSHKRARLSNGRVTTPDEQEDSWVLSPPNTVARARLQNGAIPSRPARSSGADTTSQLAVLDEAGSIVQSRSTQTLVKHQPGSIVRVTMQNFVTYTSVTFNPGPALNMVIGPNGTGKSTLVCAICLGLGWGPQHLGRAKDIGEFVKHGHSEASIEIELQGREGRTNPLIRRQIKKEGNKSSWYLNGNSSTAKAIQNEARSYAIQVDNLCQFLPQDRVAEFARLDNKELLKQTQQAAAAPQVQEWHEELKNLRKDQEKDEMEQKALQTQLEQLQARQERQRADVERLKERQEVEEHVTLLKKTRPYADYVQMKLKADELKQKSKDKAEEAKNLEDELSPLLESINTKTDYRDNLQVYIDKKKTLKGRFETEIRTKESAFNKVASEIEKVKNQIDSLQKENKKKDLARLTQSLKNLQLQKDQDPPEFDKLYYRNAVMEQQRQANGLTDQIETLTASKRERSTEIKRLGNELEQADIDLSNLRTKAGQQDKKLLNLSKDTYNAWDWLRKNRGGLRLKGNLYGPPIIECSAKEQSYVAGIESQLQRNDFLAITCDNREDFELLRKALAEKNFRVSVRIADVPLANFKPPMSDDERTSLGLDGWAIDQLNGPEPVLAMLCHEKRLHATGVAKEISNDQFERLTQSTITACITGTQTFTIQRRREYGPGAVSTTFKPIQPGKYWTDQQVDSGEETRVKQRIAECKHDKETLEKEQTEAEDRMKELRKRKTDAEKEAEKLEDERMDKERALGFYNTLDTRINNIKTEIFNAKKAEAEKQQEIEKHRMKLREFNQSRAQTALDLARIIEQLRVVGLDHLTATISYIEACSDVDTITIRNKDITESIQSAQEEANQAREESQRQRRDCKKRLAEYKKAVEDDPGLSDFLNNLGENMNRTPEELETEIEAQEARLEMLAGGNSSIIREFEKRAKDIDDLRSKLSDAEDNLTSLEQSINTTRAKWEPELDLLVSKISAAFADSFGKIQCVGSVSVLKPGFNGRDFEDWAIDIQVKFREDEQMTSLDSQRQSGGERAVSTIFYLMALQTLSRAPFRVVDEINQGMDPRNERMVHERMVDIACGSDETGSQTSQYFLITPKLLTGLKYSENMTIHCIASGEYMPADASMVDFKKLVKDARKRMADERSGVVPGVGA